MGIPNPLSDSLVDVSARLANLRAELHPVEVRLAQRWRTYDEWLDWQTVEAVRAELIRTQQMLGSLSQVQRKAT